MTIVWPSRGTPQKLKELHLLTTHKPAGLPFFDTLSRDLCSELPDLKGLSVTNLKYMKYLYSLFCNEAENRPQVVDDLSRIQNHES